MLQQAWIPYNTMYIQRLHQQLPTLTVLELHCKASCPRACSDATVTLPLTCLKEAMLSLNRRPASAAARHLHQHPATRRSHALPVFFLQAPGACKRVTPRAGEQ